MSPLSARVHGNWARLGVVALVLIISGAATGGLWWRSRADQSAVATVTRGRLTAALTATGTLRPIQSITYRSPLVGREAEIIDMAPEGAHVAEGDLLVRLNTSELQQDVDRTRQELRQLELDLQAAEGERQEATAAVEAAAKGEGALTVAEARTRMQIAENKAQRLLQEYDQLKPLFDKGFITRDELARTGSDLEQAQEELALARKRAEVVVELSHPREQRRAAVQLAQRMSQVQNLSTRRQETEARLRQMLELIERSSLYARRPGLVVYEESMGASPRRKVRVGDRVSSSQGLVTIPEVNRMLMETTVSEAELHRVHPGQLADIRLEAFPTLRMQGRLTRVGTLASSSIDRPDDKRFDVVIELDATDAELRPEMTARADIAVDTRESVLLLPLGAVFEQEGAPAVRVVTRTGIDTRAVELGESNDQLVEAVAGVHEGDRVIVLAELPRDAARGGGREREVREGGNALQPR